MGTKNSTVENKPIQNMALLEYSNGERYKGEIYENLRNGFGTYFYQNGERYEGNWYKNLKHGRGTFFYKNGEVYEGMWHNNKKEGVGTYYYKNGDRYYGEWKDNRKHGRGIIHFEEGGKFVGQFKNNKKCGLGELIKKEGDVIYEEWQEGKLIKQSEKLKHAPDAKYDIDYNELNTGTFEKYLETKTRQQYETKSNQIKSKYFTIEFAKKLKSKNIENYYDSVRMLHSTNNILIEKPDMTHWSVDDVIEVFNKLGYDNLIDKIKENKIDGKKLFKIEIKELSEIIEITDETILKPLNKSLNVLRKLNLQTENLKSIHRNLSSMVKRDINEIEEENNNLDYENEILFEQEEEEKDNINNGEVEVIKNEEEEINNNKNLVINNLASPTRNFTTSVNLNGLNYFINYDELTLQMKVGEGGFGEVFLGVWLGKKVAVKKLTVKNSRFTDNLNKFINEINIISSLRHPNIVLYMGASIDKDNYYMITEYLPKGSLFDFIHRDKGKITEREQIIIAYEIAVALKYLHSRNIIHCDLKSSNILIDDNWKIKLGDFGLSRFFSHDNTDENRGRIGTPHWMAPEVLKGEKYEHSADIFSFGMILWELLSLEIPYYGVNPYQVISLVADQKKIVQVPKEGHAVLRHLTQQCLQYEMHMRPKLDFIVETLEKYKNLNKNYDKQMDEIFEYLN